MMSRTLSILIALLMCGCQLFTDFDRSKIEEDTPADAATDSSVMIDATMPIDDSGITPMMDSSTPEPLSDAN